MLVLAAEDYTGPTPPDDRAGPKYLDEYRGALTANGLDADVYDVDARPQAPHPLGVLSHYDAVVWYTGDDYLTREPGQVPGTGTSRLALDEIVAVRDYLNEGGKVVLGGKHAGQQFFEGFEFRNHGFPQPNEDKKGDWCDACCRRPRRLHRAHERLLPVLPGGVPAGGQRRLVGRRRRPTCGPSSGWRRSAALGRRPGRGRSGRGRADVDAGVDVVAARHGRLRRLLRGHRELGAAEAGSVLARSGSQYLYSGTADEAYMRLYRTTSPCPSGDQTLKFSTSFDIELDWDSLRRDSGRGRQLDDAPGRQNGHTSQGTGESCSHGQGWGGPAPAAPDYQTKKGDTCTPTGTTGEWNAATGSSGGWQDWTIDLSAYRGQEVQIAIVYATDWAVQNLGVWLDDISLFGARRWPSRTAGSATGSPAR